MTDTRTALWKSLVKQDCKDLDEVQELFGERGVRNTMILFTFRDYLEDKTIEQHIEEAGEELQQRVEKCGNRYHVLNNKNRSDHTQVTQLLDKLDNMVKGSEGFYTMEMYSEAEERAREVMIRKKRDEQIDRVGNEKSKLLERPGELELQLELRREREKSRVLERELKKEKEKRRELEEELRRV
ncbi:GTPase IMAP family member 2-like [Acipenser ruthenus]|uniref:GTPase IMAP family member 2-like n=1 Tax=Acipenser ruthenus TaxID=7906 RepID=UPI00274163ED|nr:GTPase IMAP family member 2-like [Acipenser ruthenus]